MNTGYLASPWRGTFKFYAPNPSIPNLDTFYGNLDLFHTCITTPGSGAPVSDIGYQYAHFGEAYEGIYNYFAPNYTQEGIPFYLRDWAQGKLSAPLEAGVEYNFSVWISASDASATRVWQLGLRLSANWFYRQSHLDSVLPPVYLENAPGNFILHDCNEWIQLKGSFVAQGGEQYFMFGSTVNGPLTLPDTVTIPKGPCFDQYNALYEPMMTFPAQWNEHSSYLFMDDFAIWREDKQVYVAQAGSDTVLCQDLPQSLKLGSPARDQYHYFWLSPQGDTLGTTAQLTVSPTQTTTYILSQWDFKFDQTWDTVTVYVEPNCPELWLPTWFNPTQNQYWRPHTRDIELMELTMYNTLGQVIQRYFGHPDNYPGWDGFAIAQGVYYATVNARAYSSEQLKAVEKIMVVRQ